MDPQAESEEPQLKQKILKIIVVGDMGTGKTSLIRKYVEGNFSEFYKITIGVDFASKSFKWDSQTNVDVQLWDIAGQERFGNMTSVYYRESVGALVVFDISRPPTFEMTKFWKSDIDQKIQTSEGGPIPCLLVGNKIDLKTEEWDRKHETIQQFSEDQNFINYFETNLEDAIKFLIDYIINNNIESENSKDNHGVDLSDTSHINKPTSCC